MRIGNLWLSLCLIGILLSAAPASPATFGPKYPEFVRPPTTGHTETDRANVSRALDEHRTATARAAKDWERKIDRNAKWIAVVSVSTIALVAMISSRIGTLDARTSAHFAPTGTLSAPGDHLNKVVALEWIAQNAGDSGSLFNFVNEAKEPWNGIRRSQSVDEMLSVLGRLVANANASSLDPREQSDELARSAALIVLSSDAKALEGFSREGRELSVAAAKFILKAHLPADGLKVEVDSRTANEIRSYGGGTHYDVNLRETQVELQIAP